MKIFNQEPIQWGLRGDPELWKALKLRFDNIEDPKDDILFNRLLIREFNSLLEFGEQKSKDVVWFKNFPQSGMSGGSISLEWWQLTGLPLLKERYLESL